MSHNDDSLRWYNRLTQEERDEYNRRRYERLKAQRIAKAHAAGRTAKGDTVQCKVCGKNFVSTTPNQLYCSNPCRRKAENRRHRAGRAKKSVVLQERTCVICGKTFAARGKKIYCSKECVYEAKYRKDREARKAVAKTICICVFCGKEFTAGKMHGWAKYCSSDCCNHARYYANKEEMEAVKAEKAARVKARRDKSGYGLTISERNAVIRAQAGSRDELWRASQSWTPAQRKFAAARYKEIHCGSSFTLWR